MIIDGIRARGYEIAPVYELIGKTRADVMAPLPAGELWAARLDRFGFWLFDAGIVSITWIFLVGDLLMTGRLIFIGAAAVYDRLHEKIFGKPAEVASYKPKVAVLIPAYNEEKVIERTVRAALNSNYPNLRVIVIDDGSKDHTLEVARNAFAAEAASGKVLILGKPNSGKAEALNYGIEHIGDAELFVGIDADTIIAPDAISRLVPHFINPKVGAIAGNAKVGNRVNLWTRWQALEYITSQNFERRALDVLGAVSVVPGAIGAWRVSAVREAGGYHVDTVAEDADLTMALLRLGYRVEYEDMALAYTEAPTNANGLMRQRFRWSFGILQAVYKHRKVVARKGALGWVALPNIVIFQILLPLVSPLIDIMFVVGTIWYYIQKHFHPDSTDPADFHKLVLFFFAFLVIDFIASAIAFALERRRSRRQRRCLAAEPGLAATLRLPPAIFDRAVQDPEARAGRPQVCVGQAGAHSRGELCAGGEPRARRRAGRSCWPRLTSEQQSAQTPPDSCRQTIHVCMPGVSMSMCCTPFVFNHSRRLRFGRDQSVFRAAGDPQ